MRDEDALLGGWARIIDALMRGDQIRASLVTLGPTPVLLQELGLTDAALAMVPAKIVRARRDHPEVSLDDWRRLPQLLERPLAVVPSTRRDGSLLVVLIVKDACDLPVVVPIAPGEKGRANIVLSMYGKDGGFAWINRQLAHAVTDALPHYVTKGFAASLPQPGLPEDVPSSSGPIPVDGTTKPRREILSITRKGKG